MDEILAMIAAGDPAWREVARARLLESADEKEIRLLLCGVFAKYGDASDIPALKVILDRSVDELFHAALQAINEIDSPLSVRLYLEMLKTPRAKRLAVWFRFEQRDYAGFEDALFDGLKPLLRETITGPYRVYSLVKLYRPERLAEAVAEVLASGCSSFSSDVLTDLASPRLSDAAAMPLIQKLMAAPDDYLRGQGHTVLWRRTGSPENHILFREALRSKDLAVVSAALSETTSRRGHGIPLADVLPLARHEHGAMRVGALIALYHYPSRDTLVEYVVALLDGDTDFMVAAHAEHWLGYSPKWNPHIRILDDTGAPLWETLLRKLRGAIRWGEDVGLRLLGFPVRLEPSNQRGGRTSPSRDGAGVAIKINYRLAIDVTGYGEELFRGMILHELGHHLEDFGVRGMSAASGVARSEGLRDWFNILLDERMERKMRARNAQWGIYFDRLAAYMFLHSTTWVRLPEFAALYGMTLEAAVSALQKGSLPGLLEEDVAGVAYSRVQISMADMLRLPGVMAPHQVFLACFRSRITPPAGCDPRVGEALSLVPSHLKDCTHWDVLGVCRELAAILGGEDACKQRAKEARARVEGIVPGLAALLDQFEEVMEDAGLGADSESKAVAKAIRQQRAELAAGHPVGEEGVDISRNKRLRKMNDSPDLQFERLVWQCGPAYDGAAHRSILERVRPHIRPLRRHFVMLSGRSEDDYASRRGRRLDQGQARHVAIYPSLRVLVGERQVDAADMYLGVLIDRSSSMRGEKMERAKAFAILLAESLRELPGLDGSIDAFDDKHFFSLGSFRRCSVSALQAEGGNNDAGALLEAARLALKSKRKHKLLIMISDGTPTACSFAALAHLVRKLEQRHGILCAQVAVEKIEKIAFPYYLDVSQYDYDSAVRRFGQMLIKLAAAWH